MSTPIKLPLPHSDTQVSDGKVEAPSYLKQTCQRFYATFAQLSFILVIASLRLSARPFCVCCGLNG